MTTKLKTTSKKTKSIIIVTALFAVIGAGLLIFANAATGTATLSLSPASRSADIGTNFTLGIYENSGTVAASTVDVKLTYDATKLDFVSVDGVGGAFTTCTEATGAAGSVSLVCALLGSSVTGNQKVGNVTFKAKVGTGTTPVSFAANSHIYEYSATLTDLWNGVTTGGTYTLTTPDTTPPSVSISAPSTGSTVQGNAVAISAAATDNSGAISKVEFLVNGVLKNTDTTSPYSYTWDSTTLADGTYPIVVNAYDNAPTPNKGTTTVNVIVKNNKPNLIVSAVTQTPSNPAPGSVVTLSATITNNGTDATAAGTAVSTGFSVDSVAITSPAADTTSLAVGASRTVTTTWTATIGAHTVLANADKNNTIVELNEADNTRSLSFTVYKPGDANNDGSISSADLQVLSFNWNKTSMTFAQGDFSGDGVVNSADLQILSFNWGK